MSKRDPDPIVLAQMIVDGAAPHVIYAYRTTGIVVTDQNSSEISTSDRALWDVALKEFEAIEWRAMKDRH